MAAKPIEILTTAILDIITEKELSLLSVIRFDMKYGKFRSVKY